MRFSNNSLTRWLAVLLPALALMIVIPADLAARGKKKKKDEEFTFEEDTSRAPPSKTLGRAAKLYDKGDYYSASIEFHKVITKQTKDTKANQQKAQFFMGKTMFKMGFYAAALAYFDRICCSSEDEGAGKAHAYYSATLKWLAALSRELPETSGILGKIGTYNVTDLDDPTLSDVRDELYYLLGRHFYRKAKFKQAVEMFNKVGRETPFFIKAKFFEGVTYVRQFQGKPAVAAFKEILVIGKERPKYYKRDQIDRFVELAQLQLARVFYSTRQYDTSIRYYEKLEQKSPDWLASLFEASWAYYMKTNNSKALGNIHTLNAPYFENQFFPESMLLKSVIYYRNCLYDRALESVSEYNQKFKPLRDNIAQIIKKYDDNSEFYDYVKKIMARKAGLDVQTQRLVTSALADKTLAKTFRWVDELGKELTMLNKADKAWQTTAIAGDVLQELTLQESMAKGDAGKLARERVTRLSKELKQFTRDGIKIRIQILEEKAGQITAKAKGAKISGNHKGERIIVDDEHFMWKFNGEYWKDELGFYRFKIRSKCAKK